jgi:cardiolipin synthase
MQLMYLMSFAAARRQILIGTGYFVPDRLTIDALLAARRRGVRVAIMLPGPYNDVPVSGAASKQLWGELLREGVEFYEYQPTMYHCKLMVVDDRWCSIGSANVDNRSFRLNSEANLNVLDKGFAQEQIRVFEEDLKRCRRVTLEEWERRPGKFKEWLAGVLKWQL